jgi:glutamate synthase (NADPH/NADH) large chain
MGPEGNALSASPSHARQLVLDFPVIDNDELAKIVHINADGDLPGYATHVVRGLYDVTGGAAAMRDRLEEIFAEVSQAISRGARFVVLSDRDSGRDLAPIPSLLLTAAVHHHLIREKTRTQVGLLVEAGDVREVHHVALLIGFGAAAVNPYLAMETVEDLVRAGEIEGVTSEKAVANLIKALGKGVLKVMSKMGISTVASYRGAQVFEAIGLSQALVERYFTGTVSQLGGVGLDVIARETAERHARAYPPDGVHQPHRTLEVGGEYQWRREGEPHLFDPETVFRLQHSTRQRRYDVFKQYTGRVDDQTSRLMTLRGLMGFRPTGVTGRLPVPIEEVEPVSEIVKRFNSGAMSYGSISKEAHETLAIAMNHLGGRSNTGEGGEDVDRLLDPERRSAVKQVASGRFGVTSLYLTHSDDIQIKMAQGAKPGEGGQLPGHKVYPWVAKTRHSTPGVGLISPPPHHDIYSIEDLAQLIHDLKNANPGASVSVKLVSEVGVGTVAAGVAKAKADHVTIAGHDGGTGASPVSSIKHAGTPWELGLAETQQTLVLNRLRGRIAVQVDGQMKTGRDVAIGAMLGADEFGFATAPLVATGCIMMRKCHLNTCPVGIATQDPVLRKRFAGQPEHVVNYLFFVAEEVREIMAKLGIRRFADLIGRADLLDMKKGIEHWKARGLDFSRVFHQPAMPPEVARRHCESQDHGLAKALDHELIAASAPSLERRQPVRLSFRIRNAHRSVGAMLSGTVARRYGHEGLPEDTIHVAFEGIAGQSFGAFLARGISFELQGATNDYVGKGLSGGRIVVYPDPACPAKPEENILIGNTVMYGAIEGEAYFRGVAGERFCVRNSGATAVVEGTGDHGCEYMTGGTVVVLGRTGRNFAAGMSGGIAYVYDPDGTFATRCNASMVSLEPLQREADQAEAERALTAAGKGRRRHADRHDEAIVRELCERHLRFTGSTLALALLDDWESSRGRFVKVFPNEYKRALTELAMPEEKTIPAVPEPAAAEATPRKAAA